MGTERQPLLSTSPLVALVNPSTSPLVMMALFLLLSLATAVLAAPSPMADYVYDGSDAEFEDFDNLTMSRAAEERAINTCNCAPVSSSDRIVGGKEVNPKYKLPYQVLVSPCNKQGNCLMCGGTILNKRYVVTAAHCLYGGNDLVSLKDGATFRVLGGTPTAKAHHTQQDVLSILSNSEGTSAVTLASILSLSPCTQLRGG